MLGGRLTYAMGSIHVLSDHPVLSDHGAITVVTSFFVVHPVLSACPPSSQVAMLSCRPAFWERLSSPGLSLASLASLAVWDRGYC